MKDELIKLIFDSLKELKREKFKSLKILLVQLEHPWEEKYGDWSTNAALVYARQLKISPLELGQYLVSILNKKIVQLDLSKMLSKIEQAGPGFINFYLSKDYFYNELQSLLKAGENYGKLEKKKGKIQIEFISANPTGPLTLGNARGGFMGDTLASVLEWNGWEVQREYYINDRGKQIEALGHSVLKDQEAVYRGDYIEELSKQNPPPDPKKAGEWTAKMIIDQSIKKTVQRMNIHFDRWFSEKALEKTGKIQKIIEELEKKGLIYEKDGALWFKLSKFKPGGKEGQKDCVLKKSEGEYTYLAGDIAYHKNKFLERKFDQVINIWGADHYGDVPRLQAGVKALGVDVEKKLKFIIVQFVHLIEKGKEVKMSKRRGQYITIDELLDEIPPDVVRFFFLMYDPDTHMDFDLNLARDTSEKNPVYYVQYAYARICSIFKNVGAGRGLPADNPWIKGDPRVAPTDLALLKHPSELSLIRSLVRFPELVWEASQNYEVHRLPHYVINLAEKFHKFYQECRVIGEDKELSSGRLALVKATQMVLKNVLDLMGISAPEKM